MFLQKAWNTLDSDAENIALERGRKTFEVAEEALEKRRESYMSEVEMEDLDSMEIEKDYDGPHISVRTLLSHPHIILCILTLEHICRYHRPSRMLSPCSSASRLEERFI